MRAKSDILNSIAVLLLAGDLDRAAAMARKEYPFAAFQKSGRVYTEVQSLQVFRRDGFIDRYSGERLVFPGALRVISRTLPGEFPMHPQWKMSDSHLVYWEMFPTVDHLEPVARGGLDDQSNWITTSMVRNSAKSNWTIAELGWRIFPSGSLHDWDGLTEWFLAFVKAHPSHLEDLYVRKWHRAVLRTKGEPNQ